MSAVRLLGHLEARGERSGAPSSATAQRLPAHVRMVEDADGLAAVRTSGVNLAVWPRTLPTLIAVGLAAAVSSGFEPVRCEVGWADVRAELRGRFEPTEQLAWLSSDAAMLARTLARLAGVRRVTVRLEAIAGDACRFFHADDVALRLVTTYQGRGTQWLADADADAFGRGAVPEDRVREIGPGTVAVFRGLRGPPSGRPLVHRSPPRRAGDPVRLFLAVDPAAPT